MGTVEKGWQQYQHTLSEAEGHEVAILKKHMQVNRDESPKSRDSRASQLINFFSVDLGSF
jgi:hypothetical protein